jgi:hypothetical protein
VYGLDATLQAQPFSIRCCELYPNDEFVENRLLEFLSKARVGRVTLLLKACAGTARKEAAVDELMVPGKWSGCCGETQSQCRSSRSVG